MKLAPAIAALLVLVHAGARAQDAPEPVDEAPAPAEQPLVAQQEYGGVVTVQVATSLGWQFATRFTEAWTRQPHGGNYQLEVRERSSPRYGTDVYVRNNDDVIFRAVLPRQAAAVEALAETAAALVNDRLAELAIQQLLFEDKDMARSGL